MTNTMMHSYIMKPALAAVVGKIAAAALIGVDGSGSLPLFGMEWAPSTVVGVSVGAAVVATAATHDMVLARFQSMGWADAESKVIAPALAAVFTVAAVRYTIGPLGDLRSVFELAAIGAGSEIGGDYAHTIIMPLIENASSGGQVMAMR